MKSGIALPWIIFLAVWPAFGLSPAAHAQEALPAEQKAIVDRILEHWETWVPARKEEGTAPMMTFEELYEGLSGEETAFLNHIREIDPRRDFGFQGRHLGNPAGESRFIRLEDQKIRKNGQEESLPPQYLPEPAYEAYETMMQAMEEDLGKRLLVESGYRSPAYQLYTFLFYLPKHGYSLAETGRWVALPGYSEHGAPHVQAIDFINEEGVNGEDRPEDFEELPEYRWLEHNASRFGFVLSYPRAEKGIVFEPWHWSYRPSSQDGAR